MSLITERAISEMESAVIFSALRLAATEEISGAIMASVQNLRVVSQCECGCDSISFKRLTSSGNGRRVADGIGFTQNGEEVGVLVWVVADEITDLELYNYSDELARLPEPASIRPVG